MKPGRPFTGTPCPHFCPACRKRLQQRKTRAPSFRCPNCGRSYDLVGGELRPKVKAAKVEVTEERAAGLVMTWRETELMNGWVPTDAP